MATSSTVSRITVTSCGLGRTGANRKLSCGMTKARGLYYPHAPLVLPDASAVLFSASAGPARTEELSIKAHSFATGQTTDLVSNASFPLYSESGHLLFLRDFTLMAAPFDAARLELTGPAVPFVARVSRFGRGTAHARITRAGTLFFLSGDTSGGQRMLVTVDRKGVPTPLTTQTGQFTRRPVLSPDGSRVAVAVADVASRTESIWLLDIKKDLLSPLTQEPGQQMDPVWSPGGDWVYYVAISEEGTQSVFRRRADRGGEPELIYTQPRRFRLYAVHPIGRQLFINEWSSNEHSPGTKHDIGVIDRDGEPTHRPWLSTPSVEWNPAPSLYGQWVAFNSDKSGEIQVYVRPFATEGPPAQVSHDSGHMPFWSRDGKTLFFTEFFSTGGSTPALMAATVSADTTRPAATPDGASPSRLHFEIPKKLFDLPVGASPFFSAFPDGEHFLTHMPASSEQNDPAVIHVMLNAHERLKEIAPVPED